MAYHIVCSVVFTINVYVFRTNTEIINNETRFVQRIISYIIHHFQPSNGFHQRYEGHYIVYRSAMRLCVYSVSVESVTRPPSVSVLDSVLQRVNENNNSSSIELWQKTTSVKSRFRLKFIYYKSSSNELQYN